MKPRSACALLVHGGRVLAVSRPEYDHLLWGLPGGGIERGESPKDAAVRELWEETGLRARAATMVPLYDGMSGRFRVVTYFVPEWSGRLRSSHEGIADWRSWRDLLVGPYGEYNAEVKRRHAALIGGT